MQATADERKGWRLQDRETPKCRAAKRSAGADGSGLSILLAAGGDAYAPLGEGGFDLRNHRTEVPVETPLASVERRQTSLCRLSSLKIPYARVVRLTRWFCISFVFTNSPPKSDPCPKPSAAQLRSIALRANMEQILPSLPRTRPYQ